MKSRRSLEEAAIWIGGAIVLYLFVKTFWPVLLVLFLYGGYRLYRGYRKYNMPEGNRKSFQTDEDIRYERDLFQQQVESIKRKESNEIVDAEFFVKDREREQEHRQTR